MRRHLTVFRPTLREDLGALLLLAAVAAIVFYPWLFTGHAFYWGDIGLYFLPLARYLSASLHQGILPLWNPYLYGGTPFVGNPQAWTFYPSTTLLPFFSSAVYLMLVNVIHLWLAGAGMYIFLRRGTTKLDFFPSTAGALGYMLGGFIVSKTQFPNMVQALAYMPLVLLCTERLIVRPTATRAVVLGAVLGLQIMAAHAQISVMTLYLAALYAVACLFCRGNLTWRFMAHLLMLALLASALAVAVSCVFWLPVMELTRVAERQGLGIAEAHRFYLLPREITNLFWPLRFGSPLAGDWNAPGNFWEKACYMGLVPCLLAVCSIRQAFAGTGHKHHQTRFWLAVLVMSVLLSLGWRGGLFLLAYFIAPGMKLFHDPARMLMGAAVAIPVLAALELHRVLQRLPKLRSGVVAAVIICIITIDLGYFSHLIYPLKPVSEIEAMKDAPLLQMLRADADVESGRARVFFADPMKHRHTLLQYQTYYADDAWFLRRWSETVMPNLGMLFELQQAGGYEPIAGRNGKRRATDATASLPSVPDVDTPEAQSRESEYARRLAAMSVKYLITYGPRPLPSTRGLLLVAQTDRGHQGYRTRVYRNSRFMPRAHWHETSIPAIAHSDAIAEGSQHPDVLEFFFRSAPKQRHFVLADSAFAGWSAYLDGRKVDISTTTDGLRSVQIPASNSATRNRLVFVYQPATFTVAIFVSLCTLTLFSGMACFRIATRLTAPVQD